MKKLKHLLKSFIIFYFCVFSAISSNAQFGFTNSNSLIPTTTGISILETNGIQIYPNPANSELNILFVEDINGTTVIDLIDVTGQIVRSATIESVISGQNSKLDVTGLAGGTYVITIRTNKNLVKRLMITK